MSEFWVSQKKYYCKFCKVWMQDNKMSRQKHDQGTKHKLAIKEHLKAITKDGLAKEIENEEFQKELQKMERAALAQYSKDISSSVGALLNNSSSKKPVAQSSSGSIPEAAANYAMKRLAEAEKAKLLGVAPTHHVAPKPVYSDANDDEAHYLEDEGSFTFFPGKKQATPQPEEKQTAQQQQQYQYQDATGYYDASYYQGYQTETSGTTDESSTTNPEATAEGEGVQTASATENDKEKEENLSESKIPEKKPFVHPYGQWTRVTVAPAKPVESDEKGKGKDGKRGKKGDESEEEGEGVSETSAKDFKFVEKQAVLEDDKMGNNPTNKKNGSSKSSSVVFKKRKLEAKGNLR